jgi:hypothetical protein
MSEGEGDRPISRLVALAAQSGYLLFTKRDLEVFVEGLFKAMLAAGWSLMAPGQLAGRDQAIADATTKALRTMEPMTVRVVDMPRRTTTATKTVVRDAQRRISEIQEVAIEE